jgi:hypothetical protein
MSVNNNQPVLRTIDHEQCQFYYDQIWAGIKATQEEMEEEERAQARAKVRRGRLAFLDSVLAQLRAVEDEVAKFHQGYNTASKRWRCKPLSDAEAHIEQATRALLGGETQAAEEHIRQAADSLGKGLAELLSAGLDMAILVCALIPPAKLVPLVQPRPLPKPAGPPPQHPGQDPLQPPNDIENHVQYWYAGWLISVIQDMPDKGYWVTAQKAGAETIFPRVKWVRPWEAEQAMERLVDERVRADAESGPIPDCCR